MTPEDKFIVYEWWATSPEFVLKSLSDQLKLASAIWPELDAYIIERFGWITKDGNPTEVW